MNPDLCKKCGTGIEEAIGGCGCKPCKADLHSHWISVKEKPDTSKDVLVTDGERCWVAFTFNEFDVFLASHPDYKRKNENEYGSPFVTSCRPTHWMPLPETPKDE